MDVLKSFLLNPATVWVLIPVVAILVSGIGGILRRTQRHRERIAMIRQGMHPDYPPGERPEEAAE